MEAECHIVAFTGIDMVKSGKTAKKSYSEEQIEDLLEIQRDLIQERLHSLREEISFYPFLSMAVAFILGLALGIALSPRSSK